MECGYMNYYFTGPAILLATHSQLKEMNLFKNLKKEVETGANGTQNYVIKEGLNKGKIAKK